MVVGGTEQGRSASRPWWERQRDSDARAVRSTLLTQPGLAIKSVRISQALRTLRRKAVVLGTDVRHTKSDVPLVVPIEIKLTTTLAFLLLLLGRRWLARLGVCRPDSTGQRHVIRTSG
jgi:hypothetical protein